MRIRLPAITGLAVGAMLSSAGAVAQQQLLPISTTAKSLHSVLPSSFPSTQYTPHGYLDNPYHSMILNRSGVVRSYPPLGFGWWKTDFKGAYGSGVRDHVGYLSLLQMSVAIDGTVFADSLDFIRSSTTLSSRYHTKNLMSYDWSFDSVEVSLKYFLPRENSLACWVEITNRGRMERSIVTSATHVYLTGELKW